MKRIILCLTTALVFLSSCTNGQVFKKVLGGTSKDSTKKSTGILDGVLGGSKTGTVLTTDEIVAGLKQALEVGAENGSKKLSAVDGFFANAAIKILMPEEAKKAEEKLRAIGLGKQVDQAILSMNRAA